MKKVMSISVLVAIVIVILLILFNMKKKNENNSNYSAFYDAFLNWLRGKEGRQTTDPTEGSPAPLSGITGVRGVTYDTFMNLAQRLQYPATEQEFLAMRDQITPTYRKLVNHFFDKGSRFGVLNPVVSYYIGSWYWGSGSISQYYQDQIKLIINRNDDFKSMLSELVELRKSFFRSLVQQKPEKQKYLKNWLQRANEYYNKFSVYL